MSNFSGPFVASWLDKSAQIPACLMIFCLIAVHMSTVATSAIVLQRAPKSKQNILKALGKGLHLKSSLQGCGKEVLKAGGSFLGFAVTWNYTFI